MYVNSYVITDYGDEILALPEAKDGLNITHDLKNTEILSLITAAREAAEMFMGRAIVEQTVKCYLPKFPSDKIITLPVPSIVELLSVDYIDINGDEQTLDVADFYIDPISTYPRIKLKGTDPYPLTDLNAFNPATITYTAGWTEGAIPDMIKRGMIEHIGDMFVNRQAVYRAADGRIAITLPAPMHRMYSPYKARL